MGGYFSVAVGRAPAVVCAQQGGGPNDAADYVQTRGRGLFTPDEEKLHVAISALQATFSVIDDDNAAGQVQYTDSGDHNSIPPLDQIDVDGNRPVLPVPTPSVYVGCLSRFGGFLANHIKRVYSIFRVGCTAVMVHCTTADDGIEEQQKRCCEYSKRALVFQGCTLAAYFLAPVPSSSDRRATLIDVAMATLILAMIIDVISLKTKPKWGRPLVYLSSILQTLMTFLAFMSLDKAYGYAILSVLVLVFTVTGVALFRHKQLPAVHDEATQDHLDSIFDFSALILNLGGFVTPILTIIIVKHGKHSQVSATGVLFMSTLAVGIWVMMVTTVRAVALTRFASYLNYLLAVLLGGTLIATFITFITGT